MIVSPLFSQSLDHSLLLDRYENTERRKAQVSEKGLLYLGMGVSGGEEGARNGKESRALIPDLTTGGHHCGVADFCIGPSQSFPRSHVLNLSDLHVSSPIPHQSPPKSDRQSVSPLFSNSPPMQAPR